MNYLLAGEAKKALISIRCLTINTRANRVAIVCSGIARIFNHMQMTGGHISTLLNKNTHELFCVVNNAFCQLLLLLLFNLLFIFCSTFMRRFIR
jgi:hypothetical protein